MSTGWLVFFMVLGGVAGLSVINGWFSLIERWPHRQRPLKCLVPYVPVSERTDAQAHPPTRPPTAD